MVILTSLFFHFTLSNLIVYTITFFLIDIIILYLIGDKRKKEIEDIKNIINSIQKNKFTSPDEIKLSNTLVELEGNIKAMFLRSQNDIENLKKLEQVRTEFLGNVSHELRTPIFAIQGYLETLLDGAINDSKVNKNFLQKASHHTQNLNNLLNDLIDISMIESGQMRMSFRYFNIAEYLQVIVNDLKPHAELKNIELILHKVRKDLQIFGDKIRLKQVMTNLISNAIKYTEKGKVEIIVEEEKNHGRIIVRDTGLGISEDNLDRIFERFYRVDKDRSRTVGGTGLGLAIVKHILEAHKTRIEVKSELGKGSEFSFLLKK
ncbi:MAG: ATP-binding protein [Melioribacteraceae bacterium]|nr:ATP-binding protein [Melioribacteraceae bacterium]MCF8353108.1 ATP-binding protein [Melioribacteraceae bacterium]MCF8392746.1 ATP-binding protein [Melioribacteraceae bacterium]MCF8418277.1 ATP-binding protein [Melioribacteraceae bacterium]